VYRQSHTASPAQDIQFGQPLTGAELRLVVDDNGRDVAHLRFLSFGVRVGVWWDATALEYLDPIDVLAPLPPGWRPTGDGPVDVIFRVEHRDRATSPIGVDGFHLFEDGAFVALGAVHHRMEHLLAVLESRLHASVAARAPRHLFLHAGVVGWQDQAIVLPGASGSGKSTLVAALVDAGASYLSDEFAVIDQAGAVHPFPRRLATRNAASAVPVRVDLDARAPLGAPEAIAMPIGLVALTRYQHGAVWNASALDEASAMLALCEHALSMERDPGRCLAVLRQIVATSPVVRGTRGEAAEAAAQLLRAMTRDDARDLPPVGAGSVA
jgi:hypothetical protein